MGGLSSRVRSVPPSFQKGCSSERSFRLGSLARLWKCSVERLKVANPSKRATVGLSVRSLIGCHIDWTTSSADLTRRHLERLGHVLGTCALSDRSHPYPATTLLVASYVTSTEAVTVRARHTHVLGGQAKNFYKEEARPTLER